MEEVPFELELIDIKHLKIIHIISLTIICIPKESNEEKQGIGHRNKSDNNIVKWQQNQVDINMHLKITNLKIVANR